MTIKDKYQSHDDLYFNIIHKLRTSNIVNKIYHVYKQYFPYYHSYDSFFSNYWPYAYEHYSDGISPVDYISNLLKDILHTLKKDYEVVKHPDFLAIHIFMIYIISKYLSDNENMLLDDIMDDLLIRMQDFGVSSKYEDLITQIYISIVNRPFYVYKVLSCFETCVRCVHLAIAGLFSSTLYE